MKNKIGIIIFVIFVYFLLILDVKASNNLLVGKNYWTGYFSGDNKLDKWTEAKGNVQSDSLKSFVVDMQSVGHWVDGDPFWYFGAQVKLQNQRLDLGINKYYRYKSTITSDQDRQIFLKIAEVEMNSVKQKFEDIDNVLFEKWIKLQANVPYELDEVFYSTSNIKRVSIYYAVGWKDDTDIAENSPNKIEVKNISINNTKYDYKNIEYNKLIKNINYSYANIVGAASIDYGKKYVTLRLDRPTDVVSNLKVNDKKVKYLKSANTVRIPTKLLSNEYNEIVVYTKTSQQNKTMVFTKMIVKNSKITKYKEGVLKKLSKYENKNNSDEVNNLISRTKQNIDMATDKKDTDRVFNEFETKYDIQKLVDYDDTVYEDTEETEHLEYNTELIIGIVLFVLGISVLAFSIKRRRTRMLRR